MRHVVRGDADELLGHGGASRERILRKHAVAGPPGVMMRIGKTTPILRMFDEARAREFYVGFLGFTIDWEHRFGHDFPLYMQVSRDDCTLHLSEHHGDGSPGAAVRIETAVLGALRDELQARGYKYAKPDIEDAPWGDRLLSVVDPSGNRLIFFEPRARPRG
jgi:catechol 2,3-dioxygenase-like lactoylglutathione lyase family enzyme